MLTDEEELTIKSYDRNAHSWSNAHLDKWYWKQQMAKFKELLPSGSILEIGCGGGRDARDLVELGYGYTGTDLSSGLLSEAKKNVPGHRFLKQSLYELSFPKKFDGFWASAVLLHVPKRRISEALGSIKSTLRRGGVGYISIKNGTGEIMIDEDPAKRFFSFWKKEDFARVLEKNGFEVVGYMHDPRSSTDDWHCFFVKLK